MVAGKNLNKLEIVSFQLSASQIEVISVSVSPHQSAATHFHQAEATRFGRSQPVPASVWNLQELGEEESVEEGVENNDADAVIPLQLLNFVSYLELFHACMRMIKLR